MDKHLRTWRQDLLNKGQHDAAIYVGDKCLALTNSDGDAFWLAQVHFSINNYTRALALLSRKDLIARSLSCRYLASHCYIRQGRHEQALFLLGEDNPTHLVSTIQHNARRKLAHVNSKVPHRAKTRDRIEYSEERERDREQEKELKFQAGMCFLRGLCYNRRNAFEKAKECFLTAVKIDVQCFEAFEQLMQNSLLSPAEEVQFLSELDFESIKTEDPSVAQEAANFTKLLYTTRLSKYASPQLLTEATEDLCTHYNLADNADLLLTRAETLLTQCRFHEALAITTRILNNPVNPADPEDTAETQASLGHSPNLYPIHLAALYETGSHTTLFHLSHTLSVNAPHEPYTYLAIATYYLSTGRIPEARRFYSKASLMDPHSAPAWIGFAHTFAAEGEHDQAIAAYSTAARLFQGNHLPNLFLGMQHLALGNVAVSWEYVSAAFRMSGGVGTMQSNDGTRRSENDREGEVSRIVFQNPQQATGDPLVINELGVILFHQGHIPQACVLFRRSLEVAAELGCDMSAWVATRANLAHAYRRLERLEEALNEFDECLRQLSGSSGLIQGGVDGTGVNGATTQLNTMSLNGRGGMKNGASSIGYEERNLLGAIHTSRGLVLLSMVGMGRTEEAITALHEAVRVLGGDAGGGGMAGTLLSRALEVWGQELIEDDTEVYEDEDEDEVFDEGQNDDILVALPSQNRSRYGTVRNADLGVKTRMNEKGKGKRRLESTDTRGEGGGGVSMSKASMIERRLDQDVDDLLESEFSR